MDAGNYAVREENMAHISRLGMKAAILMATLALGACIGNAVAQQPRMYAALDALRTARAELIAATPNKGGHRARAIQLVNQAIDETNAGIRYAQ